MKIPKYVQELMSRSNYEFDSCRNNDNYAAGYTIKIHKYSAYEYLDTFKAEVERLCAWANRVAGVETAYILDMPVRFHHCNQVAVVTIFDPVMHKIEQYIPHK